MANTIDERETIEMALSLGVNPDTGNPLTEQEKAMLEGLLAEMNPPTASHPTAPGPQPGGETDLAALVQQEIARQLGGVGAVGQAVPQSFEDVLNSIDPRDSDAALAMLDWLSKNQRLQVIGNLAGGGYLFHYQEPKGTTKQGYIPGSTKGGRMVDQAVDQARASGAKARKTGMCDKCWSAVEQHEDGSITLDGTTEATCKTGGLHTIN